MLRYASWLLRQDSPVPQVVPATTFSTSTSSLDDDRPARAAGRERAATEAASRSSSASSARTLVDSVDFNKFGDAAGEHRTTSISIPDLYYRCHNLAHFPSAPPITRRYLLRFLSSLLNEQTEQELRKDPSSILSLSARFDAEELDGWLQQQYRSTTDRFEAYLARRKEGGEREMFRDREDAERWCRQSAVVKYVDGSWLQSTFQTTAGLEVPHASQKYSVSAARSAARVSWQVLSEELGDGDIEKEHCSVYERLMDSLAKDGMPTPRADDESFTDWNRDEDGEIANKQPWVAAMLQLSLSISPNEFLPEILGFNLSYEGLPLHLLITAHELRQLKIDPYYFVLHISIDNSDSGHSAMALLAVSNFLKNAAELHGQEVADKLWKRVQAGFVLADSVRTTPRTFKEVNEPSEDPEFWTEGIPLAKEDLAPIVAEERSVLEERLLNVFRKKAYAAKGLHCTAPARIGGKRIGEWLTPENLAGEEGKVFMVALAGSRAWIRPGPNSHNSRLINECEWGGRMFGAFTNTEVALMKEWAASLPVEQEDSKIVLPTNQELCQTLVEPYLGYLNSGSDIDSDLEACNYFSKAIRPYDFSGLLKNISSFSSWTKAAPTVYAKVLEQPHGIHGLFRLDTFEFLRSLVPASPVPSTNFVEELVKAPAKPIQAEQLDLILPSLFLSSALLEWMAAAGPAKLASSLGMAVVKIQRSLYGFSSDESADTVGCAGTDDVHTVEKGTWELACDLQGNAEATIADFKDAKGQALSLPALMLLLNSQPTLHLPILFGLQLGLNVLLHEPLSKADWTPSATWRERMSEVTHDSRYWIMEAIVIGSNENTRRGWEGSGDWNENVQLGFKLAQRCLSL